MAVKKLKKSIKLAIEAGKATPAPPVGPALGQAGINIMEFCKAYNAQTESKKGQTVPVVISVYEDNSFDFILKTPPASSLIIEKSGISSGSKMPGREFVGSLSRDDVKAIAEIKLPDSNTSNIESVMKSIIAQAKNMGVKLENE